MAASLKRFPGSTVRWCGRRYLIVDYAGLDAIIGREPGKRRAERIPVSEAKPDQHQADSAWPTSKATIRHDEVSMVSRCRLAARSVITGLRCCQTEPIET